MGIYEILGFVWLCSTHKNMQIRLPIIIIIITSHSHSHSHNHSRCPQSSVFSLQFGPQWGQIRCCATHTRNFIRPRAGQDVCLVFGEKVHSAKSIVALKKGVLSTFFEVRSFFECTEKNEELIRESVKLGAHSSPPVTTNEKKDWGRTGDGLGKTRDWLQERVDGR